MPADTQARREIAAMAAQMIADSALDYREAKRKAARDLFGDDVPRAVMPDNDEVDEALREHLDLFDAEPHAQRVAAMRAAALEREVDEKRVAICHVVPIRPWRRGAWRPPRARPSPRCARA